MKTTYKILIICTFVIALFFFGKWMVEVWPRYEWREKIIIRDTYIGDYNRSNEFPGYYIKCESLTAKTKVELKGIDEKICDKIENCENDILNADENSITTTGYFQNLSIEPEFYICYIREKVRIN